MIRPRHAPGWAAFFFDNFLFGGTKRKKGGVRGAAPAILIFPETSAVSG
jgi:hypothetical protein